METLVFGKEEVSGFRDLLQKYRSKTDVVLPASQLFMKDDGRVEAREYVALGRDPISFSAMPTVWAQKQIAEYLGIHATYMEKMRTYPATDLMAQNVNYWFSKSHDRRLVRIFENEMIGFLSDRYHAIDNYEVLTTAMQAAQEIATEGGFEVQMLRPYLSETAMNATLLTTDYVFLEEGNEQEKYRMGINVRNSEVGNGAFSIRPMLLRTSCMNSNIFGGHDEDTYRKIHIGKKLGLGNIWSQDTLTLQNATVRSEIRDVTRAAFSREIAIDRINRMKGLKNEKFTPAPERIEATRRILNLTEGENKAIWDKMAMNTRYEFLQAVTSHAQSYYVSKGRPERGTELEELGGTLIDSDSIWGLIEKETARKESRKSE